MGGVVGGFFGGGGGVLGVLCWWFSGLECLYGGFGLGMGLRVFVEVGWEGKVWLSFEESCGFCGLFVGVMRVRMFCCYF